MKKPNFFLICILSLSTLFLSCSDEKESDSSSNNLITGSWQKNKVETRINSEPWIDITTSCNIDDVEEYEANKDWTLFPGTNTCNSESIITGKWNLRANNTKLVYTYDGFPGEYESSIESLTQQNLVLTQNTGDVNNTQFRFTYSKVD